MFLTITIDTEEDSWGQYDRPSYPVENIRRVPRLQQIFDCRGVRPTYLITYPVATSPGAVETLAAIRESDACEIGTHPHPWNTPPLEEERTPYNSFISNLDADLQHRKIKCLHDTIAHSFGVAPRTYRSGRWGFSEDVARNLMRLGYATDTSIAPMTDWSAAGGPDYSRCVLEPFVYREPAPSGRSLLEVPASIEFLQRRRSLAVSAHSSIRRLPLGDKALAVLARAGVLNYVWLSPETHTARQMIRLTEALRDRGTKVANMFFHSPSLLEGCSPFVRTAQDAADFLARIDEYLAFAVSAGLQCRTMGELQPADVGATTVRILAPSGAPSHAPAVHERVVTR